MIGIENLHLTIEGKDILKSLDLHLQTGVYDWMTASAYLPMVWSPV
jgi:Fe-S cluster assembly ATPase SufC